MISNFNFRKTRVKCFCQTPELIENYEQAINDKTQVWECHHRDEIKVLPSGMIAIRSKEELIENGRYYNCPPNELIFLTKGEHSKLHRNYEKKIKKLFGEKTRKGIKHTKEERFNQSKGHLSEFGKMFYEHFGILPFEAGKKYSQERYVFKMNGCFSDELPNINTKE